MADVVLFSWNSAVTEVTQLLLFASLQQTEQTRTSGAADTSIHREVTSTARVNRMRYLLYRKHRAMKEGCQISTFMKTKSGNSNIDRTIIKKKIKVGVGPTTLPFMPLSNHGKPGHHRTPTIRYYRAPHSCNPFQNCSLWSLSSMLVNIFSSVTLQLLL